MPRVGIANSRAGRMLIIGHRFKVALFLNIELQIFSKLICMLAIDKPFGSVNIGRLTVIMTFGLQTGKKCMNPLAIQGSVARRKY